VTPFVPGDLGSPYYVDLAAASAPAQDEAARQLAALTRDRDAFNPVSVAQLGLVAWERRRDATWLAVAGGAAEALAAAADADGRIAYRFPMPHTYAIEPPWCSAMAQGQAASLLLRLGGTERRPELVDAGFAALQALVAGAAPLVAATPQGPVLQEYPTSPPSHVLNGWIFALFGLYDAGAAEAGTDRARDSAAAFAAGAETVAARVHLYETWGGWSRYDLYPHPLAHVASPFYHRLHVELLRALHRLAPDPRLLSAAARFEVAAAGTLIRSVALVRKGAFRFVRPRRWRHRR
jgi:D-glucuronyl C5-epimerase C-terminus